MSDKVKVGFVCGKGHGHTQWAGGIDYGVCWGKSVADIFISLEEKDDLYPEYRGLKTAEDVAHELRGIISEWDKRREEEMWDE